MADQAEFDEPAFNDFFAARQEEALKLRAEKLAARKREASAIARSCGAFGSGPPGLSLSQTVVDRGVAAKAVFEAAAASAATASAATSAPAAKPQAAASAARKSSISMSKLSLFRKNQRSPMFLSPRFDFWGEDFARPVNPKWRTVFRKFMGCRSCRRPSSNCAGAQSITNFRIT